MSERTLEPAISRTSKVKELAEAARWISPGTRIAFGGFPMFAKPMAFVRELIRQGTAHGLTVVGSGNGPDVDLLAAAGMLDRVESAYVGLEQYGLARNFTRAAEAGEIEVVDYSEGVAFDRFRASQDGLTFVPVNHLGGTDLVRENPDIVEYRCPITNNRQWAVPAANIDVSVIHAPAADEFGNVLYPVTRLFPQGLDHTLANAADTTIITVERIISNAFVRGHPWLTRIPAFRASCVVHAPFGAHPTAMAGFYEIDHEHMQEQYSQLVDNPTVYLDTFVHQACSNADYLSAVGLQRLVQGLIWEGA